jgi:hypothetical protein
MEEKRGPASSGIYEFRLRYDSRDPGQIWKVSLIHAVDVWSQVELLDRAAPLSGESPGESVQAGPALPDKTTSKNHLGIQLIASDGRVFTGYLLFTRLVRSLPLLWLLALFTWIPGLSYVGKTLWPGSVAISMSLPNEPSDFVRKSP